MRKMGRHFFTKACSDSTWGNSFKLKESRFKLDIKKKVFTMRVVRHWNNLLREVVDALYPWKCSRPGWMGLRST